ncbi:hypothetical protein LJC24_00415 [Desulfococcaceae bacterium OttesenSCG-928-F15]|nr:hypothetical protein [Desulfococcaceae bacterium OttesenSCG-928-F15]
MDKVYILWHTRGIEPDEEKDCKLIGVYSSKQLAMSKLNKYKTIKGFKDYPDGFEIIEQKIDEGGWKEGFSIIQK